MPNHDGTGPAGKGSKTGRGLGNCKPNNPSENNQSNSRGQGRGRGQGLGQGKQNRNNR